jgi:tetratricopeptide (TPR) repeat protein
MRAHLGLAIAILIGISNTAPAAAARSADLASVSPRDRQGATHEIGRQNKPDPGVAYLLRCLWSYSIADYRSAVRECSWAIHVGPDNANGFKLRGMAHLAQGESASALADFDQAERIDPKDPEVFAARATLLRNQGRIDDAVGQMTRAIKIAPSEPSWWNARCWTRAIGGRALRLALADCNTALRLNPEFADALESRGFVYLRLERYRESVRDYDRVIEKRPDQATALFGRGVARLRLTDRGGRADLARARALSPAIDDVFARYGIAAPGPRNPRRNLPRATPARPAQPEPHVPMPPNDAPPSRSASLDLNHGTSDGRALASR